MKVVSRLHASIGVASGLLAAIAFSVTAPAIGTGATHRTDNFVVSATSADLAREAAETAELHRKNLAVAWLGHELPPWSTPCPIDVKVGPALGLGSATSFSFVDGHPTQWLMTVQGPRQRTLDSAIPHEILHTVLATHFGRPIPRWADEGAAVTVEHASEKAKTEVILRQCLTSNRGIPLSKMLEMMDYPLDVMPLYAQGHSLVTFLIKQDGGRLAFIKYLKDAMDSGDWPAATKRHYGYENLGELQVAWNAWLAAADVSLAGRLAGDADSRYEPNDDIAYIPSPRAVSHPTASPVPSARRPTLPVADVIRLVKADVPNTVIVRHIRRHCLAAPLTTDDLISLTRSGAGATVISALQDLPVAANSEAITGNDTGLHSPRDNRDGSEEPGE